MAWLKPLCLSALTSISVTTAVVSAANPAGDPQSFEVLPAQLGWEELSPEVFDRAWILPSSRTTPGRDLLQEMRDLLDVQFDIRHPDGSPLRCFGDVVVAARSMAPEARQGWLAELVQTAPKLIADWGLGMNELLLDEQLQSARWNPSKTNQQDGLLLAETWDMQAEGPPWNDVGVRPLMEQSAALVFADLASIKAIENDYRAYPQNVGADYEEIFPVDGSYFVGADPTERPFSALTIRFRCDLPFPFSDYSTRLHILNQFDEADVLSTHIYSTSEDFYWLAGRDVFLPVVTSKDKWVAFLLIRHFGFDMDGVPDSSDNRREALRSSVGNLKRNAERTYRAVQLGSGAPSNELQILKQVRVLGSK
ncbi:MAG: hypothetical protein ACI8TQ_002370 [Planctomycetota bacterium]|jgi:hypothetical protein